MALARLAERSSGVSKMATDDLRLPCRFATSSVAQWHWENAGRRRMERHPSEGKRSKASLALVPVDAGG